MAITKKVSYGWKKGPSGQEINWHFSERQPMVTKILAFVSNYLSHKQRDRTRRALYSTKILIFSFIWAGLAALHKARYNIMKVAQS